LLDLSYQCFFIFFCDLFGNLRVNSKAVKERAYSSLVRQKLEYSNVLHLGPTYKISNTPTWDGPNEESKPRVYLEKGKQNKMCAFVNMWMTISCSGYKILHTEVAPCFRKGPLMTFIGPLMMYNNFSVTVYGALDHVHIFCDFRLVNVLVY
jgi:hypothetical protein